MSSSGAGLNNSQIVESINSVAEKEGLNPEILFRAIGIEMSYEIGRRQYGDTKIFVDIDRKTGHIVVCKRFMIVEDGSLDDESDDKSSDANPFAQSSESDSQIHRFLSNAEPQPFDDLISLSEAKRRYPRAEHQVGDIITDHLPGFNSGYLIAKIMKPKIEKVITSLVREKQYNAYKDRVGDLVVGVVKKSIDLSRSGSRSMILDINGTEGILYFSSLIKGETFRPGDRVRCVIQKVEYSLNRPQIVLSRSSGEFLSQLFAQQVPEIYDRIVEVKCVARDPGSRAKVAVFSSDRNIDSVGACIGIGGSRINAISNELNGEKIDVIEYSSDLETFIMNAMKPVKPVRIDVDEERKRVELVIPDDYLSLFIGRKGQNISLLSSLIGYRIEALGATEVSKKKMEEFLTGTEHFVEALNVEEVIAQLLVTEGFSDIQEIADCEVSRLAFIEGFDSDIAEEIKNRACEYINNKSERIKLLIGKYEANDDLLNLADFSEKLLGKLLSSGLKKLEDVAELSSDELKEVLNCKEVNENTINELIITARKSLGWF